jgi:hypothetical protein
MALPPFDPPIPQTRVHYTDGTVESFPLETFEVLQVRKRGGCEDYVGPNLYGANTVIYLDHLASLARWDQNAIDRFGQLQPPETAAP